MRGNVYTNPRTLNMPLDHLASTALQPPASSKSFRFASGGWHGPRLGREGTPNGPLRFEPTGSAVFRASTAAPSAKCRNRQE